MIRQAVSDDIAAIERIAQAAFSIYLPRMERPPGPMLEDYPAHVAAGRAFVAGEGSRIDGFSVLVAAPDHLLLDVVAVAPEAQGRGICRVLVEHAVAKGRRLGLVELRLFTNEAMAENLGLYAHLGFVETHRAVQNGYRRVFMTLKL